MYNFDGTNPLLEALGDEPEIKDITLTNSSAFIIVEPLTQVRLQPFDGARLAPGRPQRNALFVVWRSPCAPLFLFICPAGWPAWPC